MVTIQLLDVRACVQTTARKVWLWDTVRMRSVIRRDNTLPAATINLSIQ